MTHTPPDWTKPETLEGYREYTGDTCPIAPDAPQWPDSDGAYWLAIPLHGGWRGFRSNGTSLSKLCPWRIRNKEAPSPSPELVERMEDNRKAWLHRYRAIPDWRLKPTTDPRDAFPELMEARAIQAALEAEMKPVDPLDECEAAVLDYLEGMNASPDAIEGAVSAMGQYRREMRLRGLAIGKGDGA